MTWRSLRRAPPGSTSRSQTENSNSSPTSSAKDNSRPERRRHATHTASTSDNASNAATPPGPPTRSVLVRPPRGPTVGSGGAAAAPPLPPKDRDYPPVPPPPARKAAAPAAPGPALPPPPSRPSHIPTTPSASTSSNSANPDSLWPYLPTNLSSDAKRFLESLNKFKGDGASIATAIWESQGRVDNGQDLRDKLYGAAVKIKPDIFPDRPYPSSTQRVEIVWIVRCGWHPLEFVSIIVRAFDGQIPVLDYEWRGHVDSQNPWFNWCAQFETQCGLE